MKISTFLFAALGLAALGTAQRSLHVDPDHFKVDKHKADVHPRRLAFNNKDGRHQPRVVGKKNRHGARQDVRSVTHHLTTHHH